MVLLFYAGGKQRSPGFHSAVDRHKQLFVSEEEGEIRWRRRSVALVAFEAAVTHFDLVLDQGFKMFLNDFQVASAQVCK